MDKKKVYLIIGGVVLVIALVIALVIGLGGNKTETPNGDTTTPTVNESVGDNSGETTTPEGGETTTPDGNETTTPDGGETGETTGPFDGLKPGDKMGDGVIYEPNINVDDYDSLKQVLDANGDNFVKSEDDRFITIYVDDDTYHVITERSDGTISNETFDGDSIKNNGYDADGNLIFKTVYEDGIVKYSYDNGPSYETTVELKTESVGTMTRNHKGASNVLVVYDFKLIDGIKYYTRMEDGFSEHFVEYVSDKSTIMKTYTATDYATGEKVIWTFDGAGNSSDHIVSLTRTVNGVTTTYDRNSIPWGTGMIFPPDHTKI